MKMTSSLFWANGFSGHSQPLRAIPIEELYARIQKGSDGLQSQVSMLRGLLAQGDDAGYQQRKRFLPYFLAAEFRDGRRRMDHLVAAYGWVIDLDHACETPEQFLALRDRLWRDPRIELLFISPSGKGLKLLFRFAEPLRGSKPFSDAYQAFTRQFARQYDLQSVVDFKTHDVSRVCFLSHDPDVLYRPEPLLLYPDTYLELGMGYGYGGASSQDPLLGLSESLIPPLESPGEGASQEEVVPRPAMQEDIPPLPEPVDEEEASPSVEPTDEQWLQIRQTLSPEKSVRQRQVQVPEEIEQLTPQILQAAQDLGLSIKDTLDLNYGRKFVFGYQHLWAEVNVYYGKHGFSVIKSPKSGSHAGLRDMGYDLLHRIIFDPEGLSEIQGDEPLGEPPW